MGDRYILNKQCIHCGEHNEDIWYAPTSNSYTFNCETCRAQLFIKADFTVIDIKDVTFDDVREGFKMTTMGSLTEEQIDDTCKDFLVRLKGGRIK